MSLLPTSTDSRKVQSARPRVKGVDLLFRLRTECPPSPPPLPQSHLWVASTSEWEVVVVDDTYIECKKDCRYEEKNILLKPTF